MKYSGAMFIMLLLSSCATDSFNYPYADGETAECAAAALFDPLASLYPDTDVSSGADEFITDIPKNAAGSVILIVRVSDADEEFRISLSGDKTESIEFFELQDIPVLQNTGYFGMTEKNIGFDNKYIIRNAPFSVYEVLKPSSPGIFSGKKVYAFFLKRRIEADSDFGAVHTEITVRGASGKLIGELSWILNVHSVVLPEGEGNELYYTNWFRGPQEGFSRRFDEDWWRLMESHLKFMREGGQNVAKIHESIIFDNVEGQQRLNARRLDRFMSLAEKIGFLMFEGPPPAGRGSAFLKKDIVLKFSGYETYTDEATELIAEAYGPLYDFLLERGSLEVWLQHVLDEPLSKHSGSYQWTAAQIRRAMPGVRILDAIKTRKPLVGVVNIWIPLVSDFQSNYNFFSGRMDEGEEVWTYGCMVPGGPWLNRTMDQERLRSVYIGWGSSKFGTKGYLRWDLDSWRKNQNIWEGELSGSEDSLIRRPFGDGFVVFPGENGLLLSTTRWEAGRIGMDDYRLLEMMKDNDIDAYKRIVSMCFTDFKTYNTDPAVYRKARKELLLNL